MNKYAGLIDSLWCLIFGITSLGGWLWFYWNVTLPPWQML